MDNDQNKQRVADAGAIPHLIALLHAPDTFAQSQSAGTHARTHARSHSRTHTRAHTQGALSEGSIRNGNTAVYVRFHVAHMHLYVPRRIE